MTCIPLRAIIEMFGDDILFRQKAERDLELY